MVASKQAPLAWVIVVACIAFTGVPARAHGVDEEIGDDAIEDTDLEEHEAAAPAEAEPEQAITPHAKARAWSFGPYVRYVVVPAFMLELFVDLAPSASNASFGVSARYRTPDGPFFDFGIGYAAYGFEGAFRAKGGTEAETEWIESNLGLLHLSGSIMWESELSKQFAFEYGVGLDFGIVTGEFKRTEAFGAPGAYSKCAGVQRPAGIYCTAPVTPGASSDPYNVRGEQYGVVEQSVPSVMALPMLPRLGLRYSPIAPLSLRAEASYGIAQFWFGLAASYAPEF